MPKTTTDPNAVALREPLKLADGRILTEIVLRAPRVRDLKAAQRASADPVEQELAMLARLTGLVPEDLDEMHLADYARLQARFRADADPGAGAVAGNGPAGAVVPVSAE